MTPTRVFNESVFDSYANLKSFFDRSNAVEQVLTHRNEVFSQLLNPLNPKLARKWQICQCATAPFRRILAIVLGEIAKIPAFFGAKQLSEHVINSAERLKIGFTVFSENTTHLFNIANSRNHPNREGTIVKETRAIPESRITDPKVKSRTCIINHEVPFTHPQGICMGESLWFLNLYLKTKNQFSDPRSHMAALGQQFADGGGMDPTLLQSLNLKKGKLLGLKIGTQPEHSGGRAVSLIRESIVTLMSFPEYYRRQLQNLPAGAYAIGLPIHQTAFIKINPTLSFFFDPNRGIKEINGTEQGDFLYKIMIETSEEILRSAYRVEITDLRRGPEGMQNHPNFAVDLFPVFLRSQS